MSESEEEELLLWWLLKAFGGERRFGDVERQLNDPVSPFLPKHPVEEGGGRRK